LGIALVFAPLAFWNGGVLDEETLSFIRHYQDGRSLIRQVLDPHTNDFGTYQARELSYLADALDARVFRALLVRDHVLFFNASTLVAGLLTVALVAFAARCVFPGLSRTVALLALLVYLSTCVLSSTQGIFYRATKPLVAPCLLAALLALRRGCREPAAKRGRLLWPALVFALAVVASLLDRQGFYETAVGAVCLGFLSLRRRVLVPATVALFLASAVGLAYNYWLGPWLIHTASGYWPSFEYQHLSIDDLLRADAFLRGAHLTLVFLASFFASLSPLALVGLALLGVAVVRRRPEAGGLAGWPGGPFISALALLAFVAAQFLLVTLMVVRQPYMYDIRDGWRWYHPLPLHAMTLFGLLWLLERRGITAGSLRERWAMAALALIATANLAEWPVNRAQMQQGPWFGKVARQSSGLRESLRAGTAQPSLEGAYRRFYFYCLETAPVILARSRPQAGEGRGFFPAEVQGQQLVAASRRMAVVRLLTPSAGRFVFRAELWAEHPGDVIRVFLPSGAMEEAGCGDQCAGPIRVMVSLDLPAGASELRLESKRGNVDAAASGQRPAVAFRVVLPFVLEASASAPVPP
jgi:hypothetical protein